MNLHDINLIQQNKGYPSLTITLPTHRSAPENRQDPIRVKNLVEQATNRLLEEFNKRDIEVLIGRLQALAEEIDYRNTLDGLALFINHDFARVLYLPFTLKERVAIDETFFIRDLVFAMNRTPRYWVLALSEKPTRLFEATRENLVEISEGGFPMTHERPGGEESLPGGFGVRKSAYRDERHRQFFRDIDAALRPFLLEDPIPLAVVGVDRYLSFYKEVSDHKKAFIATLNGSHDKTSAHELGKLVWPLVKVKLAEERQQVLGELDKAIGERKFASTVGEVWRAAHEGRGRLLLVEEDYHYPARVDKSGAHLTPAEDVTAPDVLDDAVDEIISAVLEKQGKVVFVENGQLKDHQRIALILRY
ncbi:MAG: hypothetical protein R6W69_05825 [Anaerolineales bacterium]